MNTDPNHAMSADITSCWVISDGKPGMENQCLGLAEALGLTPEIKRISLRPPWRQLSPYFRAFLRFAPDAECADIDPPWPDLVIATGRQSVPVGLRIRRTSRGRTFLVQIQDPVIDPKHFDLVVVPSHDRVRAENVLVTTGSMHRVTREQLSEAAARSPERLSALPQPRVAVLIGGDNAVYRLTGEIMRRLAEQIAALSRNQGVSFMITPSRRTGAGNEKILRQALDGLPVEIWDGNGDNPYFAYLGLADHVIATADSVNMVSEAAATGKPVHIVDLEGGSPKFTAFHESMRSAGITRPFTGVLASWTYTPPSETRRAAEEIRRRFAARTAGEAAA